MISVARFESCGLTLSKSMGGDDHETGCSVRHTNDGLQQKYGTPVLRCMANTSRSVFVRAAMCPTTEDWSERWVRKAQMFGQKMYSINKTLITESLP